MCTRSRAPGRKPRTNPSGYSCQWRCFFMSLPCWRHCSDMFGLIIQGENFDTDLCGWIRWRRRLSVASFLKALLLKIIGLLVMSLVGADMVSVVVCRLLIWSLWSFLLFLFLFSMPMHSFWSCDLASSWCVYACVCVCWVGCVHPNYAEAGCVLILYLLDAPFEPIKFTLYQKTTSY